MPNYGHQPGLLIARKQRWSIAALSREFGITTTHLRNALLGYVHPSDQVREQLPRLLNCTLAECFTEKALSKPYTGVRGNRWNTK